MWTWSKIPLPNALFSRAARLLVESFVHVTPDLNPGLVMVTAALLHCNRPTDKCLFSNAPDVEARILGGTIRLVLSRYREVKKSEKRIETAMKKTTVEESRWLQRIMQHISLSQRDSHESLDDLGDTAGVAAIMDGSVSRGERREESLALVPWSDKEFDDLLCGSSGLCLLPILF